MKLNQSRKAKTTLLVFAMLGSLSGQQLKAYKEPKGPEIHVIPSYQDSRLENIKISRDTSSLFYYSFERQKTVKYKEHVKEASISFVSACTGGSLVLSAPDYGTNAKYEWEGPNGFTSSSQDIKFKDLEFSEDGIYTVMVSKEDLTVYGKIKLIVKKAPESIIEETEFMEGELIHITAKEEGNGIIYRWQNEEGKVVSKSRDLWLPAQMPGNYIYKLRVEQNGCKVSRDFAVRVSARSTTNMGRSFTEVLLNPN